MKDEEILALPDDEFEKHWDDQFDAISTVYGLRPGHVLTQEDFDAIQKFDADYRENEETATAAFHRGYMQGLREGGSADIEEMREKLDKQFCEHGVDKAMRRLAERRCEELIEAAQALGAMPEGYCFCSKDRVGDDSKQHEPECRDLRELVTPQEG